MQRLRTVTSLDVSAVAGHHAMPAALLSDKILQSRIKLGGLKSLFVEFGYLHKIQMREPLFWLIHLLSRNYGLKYFRASKRKQEASLCFFFFGRGCKDSFTEGVYE